jgi:hypothetical protein
MIERNIRCPYCNCVENRQCENPAEANGCPRYEQQRRLTVGPVPEAAPHKEVAPDRVVEAVRADLLRRSIHGFRKYGAGLDTNPAALVDQLRHAYEESLDLCNYLKWSIMRLEGSAELVPNEARGSGLGVKVSPVRRCQGGAPDVYGRCLACFASRNEDCLSPAAG